jgi:hypothetical protein
MICVQSKLCIAPDLRKNVSHAVVHCSYRNSYSLYAARCVCARACVHAYSSQYGDAGPANEIKKKNWDSSECRVPFYA